MGLTPSIERPVQIFLFPPCYEVLQWENVTGWIAVTSLQERTCVVGKVG